MEDLNSFRVVKNKHVLVLFKDNVFMVENIKKVDLKTSISEFFLLYMAVKNRGNNTV